MPRLITLSTCGLVATVICLSGSSAEAGGKWWNKGNFKGHNFLKHHAWHGGHHHHHHYPYYRRYPVVVQQPIYTQPVVVQSVPTTSIEVATRLTQVPTGATITLSGQRFGSAAGTVGIAAGELMLSAEVLSWSNDAVTIRLPELTLAGPSKAKFIIFRANQSIADEVPFELVMGSRS
jgi:hypothetical protein